MRKLLRWPACDAAHGWQRVEQALTADEHPAVALIGPETTVEQPFTDAIPSWSAVTPGESWVEIELRVRRDGRWSRFYRLARWDDRLEQSTRTSFGAQRDEDARVAVDTLVASQPCDAVQARLLLCGAPEPTVRAFSIVLSHATETPTRETNLPAITEIAVPLRSQMVYPNGGNVWCSPTSVTMLLNYWHERTGEQGLAPYLPHESVPELAVKMCYDPAYQGTGNWIFNAAFAASLGMDAYIDRFSSLEDLVPWLQAGVPVIISVAWDEGELTGAAVSSSNGHLLIVTGFDGAGGVFVADPAGSDASQVRRHYRASEIEHAWQNNSQGTVYMVYPHNWAAPAAPVR